MIVFVRVDYETGCSSLHYLQSGEKSITNPVWQVPEDIGAVDVHYCQGEILLSAMVFRSIRFRILPRLWRWDYATRHTWFVILRTLSN